MDKTKFDFIISDDRSTRIVFRYDHEVSVCHMFDMSRPKTHNNIYKTYLYYQVYYETFCDWNEPTSEMIWDNYGDECSAIDEVAYIFQQIADNVYSIEVRKGDKHHIVNLLDNKIEILSYGVIWTIRKVKTSRERKLWDQDMTEYYHNFEILMTRRFDGVSYVFQLSRERLKEFGDFLEFCFNYTLENGVEI